MQMSMLVHSSLDIFEQRQKFTPKSTQANSTYLGQLMETFIGSYELDMYGYISLTNVKYVILKNEIKTSLMGEKPSDRMIKDTFRDL